MSRTKLLMLAVVCGVCVPYANGQGMGQGQVRGVQTPYSEPRQNHFFFSTDLGGEWTVDTHVEDFFDDPFARGAKVTFEPGVRFGVSGGWFVTDWLAIGGETGVMANWVDSVSGPSIVDDVYFSNIPFLFSVRLQAPSNSRFVPYIGGGVGGSASVIDADTLRIGGTTMHGSDSTVVFAWEAVGGFKVIISDGMSVGLEYRYFATEDPVWEADDFFGVSNEMQFDGVHTHCFSFVFAYNF